ncbi:MAG: aldose 1-epimerase family protein [Firmicutes bacterium]|nr:aldose 1-epimerase family protein [Bacillota bacterium]
MSKEVKIQNSSLAVTISSIGAEITSVKKGEKELIWQADPTVWKGHAPLLFPICGGLKDDKFIYDGKEYIIAKHGFARNSEFEVETASKDNATFLLKSNDETKKCYPFDFELRVIYSLKENELTVTYDIKNTTDGDMYFSIGSHEAYSCPGGINEWSVIFDKEEDLIATPVDGPLLTYDENVLAKNTRILPLKDGYFEIDALVFLNLKSRKLTLKNDKTGDEIKLDFDGFPYLLIWTKPNAKYICLEPWCGIPDFVDSDFDITKKNGIIHQKKGEGTNRTHKILF